MLKTFATAVALPLTLSLALSFSAVALPAAAQPPSMPTAADIRTAPPSLRPSVQLGSGPAQELWEDFFDQTSVRNVTGAGLYPVRPASGHSNGRAVIVVPGGGYRFVSIQSEGFRVADALAAEGYTAFVLKYRTIDTPVDRAAYLRDTIALFANLGRGDLADNPPAVADLATAIRHVRDHAADYGVDPAQIGVVGFSAGSRTAIRLIEHHPEAALLENVALIYPPMVQTVSAGPRPPLFLAVAADDPLFRQGGLSLAQHWLAESPRVELHLYSGGGHGFGMRPNGTTSDLWFGQYAAWLDRH